MTPSPQNWVKKTQICISSTTSVRKIKIRNFGSKHFFLTEEFLNFETLILVVMSLWRDYQSRTCIQDTFFNFLKLQIVLVTDSAGYVTEELLSRIPVFAEHHWWLIINAQAYYNRPELLNFDKIVEKRGMQSHWLTYFIQH